MHTYSAYSGECGMVNKDVPLDATSPTPESLCFCSGINRCYKLFQEWLPNEKVKDSDVLKPSGRTCLEV